MKRFALLAVSLTLLMLIVLSACAPIKAANGPTPTATDLVFVKPDKSFATPALGYAERPRSQGIEPLQLHSEPDMNSPISGEIFPGDQGIILGIDASQKWVLVQFADQVGWTPVMTLALTISN